MKQRLTEQLDLNQVTATSKSRWMHSLACSVRTTFGRIMSAGCRQMYAASASSSYVIRRTRAPVMLTDCRVWSVRVAHPDIPIRRVRDRRSFAPISSRVRRLATGSPPSGAPSVLANPA